MLRVLGLTLKLWVVLALLAAAAQTAGQLEATPTSLTQIHLTDCAPPCWIGIVPGETTVAEAKAKISAVFGEQPDLHVRSDESNVSYIASNSVEVTVEGDAFSLSIRLNLGEWVDGKNEIVQSIGLFETRADLSRAAPTVADILGAMGAPDWVGVEETVGIGKEITLRYEGLAAVFYSRADRPHVQRKSAPVSG